MISRSMSHMIGIDEMKGWKPPSQETLIKVKYSEHVDVGALVRVLQREVAKPSNVSILEGTVMGKNDSGLTVYRHIDRKMVQYQDNLVSEIRVIKLADPLFEEVDLGN